LVDHASRGVTLKEAFEDLVFFFWRDPNSSIAYADLQKLRSVLGEQTHVYCYLPAIAGKFERIGNKIKQYSLQLVVVKHGLQVLQLAVEGEPDVFLLRKIAERVGNVTRELDDIPHSRIQFNFLHLHFAKIQQLVYEVEQPSGIAVNKLELSLFSGIV